MTKNVATKSVAYYEWDDGTTRSWEQPEGLILTPGVWTNITPSELGLDPDETYGASTITFDPSDRRVLYATFDEQGLWKSTDRGLTWVELGSGTASGGSSTTRLDSPVCLAVDPTNPLVLVATQGIRGTSQGFWRSTDGGATWSKPAGFSSVAPTNDVTSLAIDPTDWNHMLLGSHSMWGSDPAGILETTDGGLTWVAHEAEPTWPTGSMSLAILHHPTLDQGNSDTWLVQTDGDGIWRTTNGGSSFTKVANYTIAHGAVHPAYYAPDGTLYGSGAPYVVRSTNNGASWSEVTNLPSSYYQGVIGDGTTLYTREAYPSLGGFGSGGMKVSTNGTTWANQAAPGNQTMINGILGSTYDEVNDIVYVALWNAGIWALKPIRA
jgi:hypothetical protein